MKKHLLTATCGILVTLGAATTLGTAVAGAQVVVRIGPPPPPIVERIPPPPPEHPYWAWHPGYHRWDGERYIWVPGTYVEPPFRGAFWVPGHWRHRPGGYVWIEGHWRR